MKLLFSLLGLFGKIPFLGFALKWVNPVWGFVLTIIEVVWTLIKNMIKGTVSFLKDPLETVAVMGWIVVGVFVGIYIGIQWNKHLAAYYKGEATHYKGELTKVHKAGVTHDRDDAKAAERATAARLKAETEMRAQLAAEDAARRRPAPLSLLKEPSPVATDAGIPAGQPKRVRNNKNRVRADKQESSVWESIQKDFNKLYGESAAKN